MKWNKKQSFLTSHTGKYMKENKKQSLLTSHTGKDMKEINLNLWKHKS